MSGGDDRQPQQAPRPAGTRPVLGRKREQGLDERLEPERGPDLHHEMRRFVSGVPEPVRLTGGDAQPRARTDDRPALTHMRADAPGEDLHALLLSGMHVEGEHVAVRLQEHLEDHGTTAGLERRPAKDEAEAGGRALECCARADHDARSVNGGA